MTRDLVLPNLECDVTREHEWLGFTAEAVASYNAWDCRQTALAYKGMIQLLHKSGNWDYWQKWFREVVPAGMQIQRRGMGQLNKGHDKCKCKRCLCCYRKKVLGELEQIEDRLLAETTLFERMSAEAEAWLIENREAHPTWKAKLENGYASRCRKVDEAREKFLNSTKMRPAWLFEELGFKAAPKGHKRAARSTDQSALIHIYTHLRKMDLPKKWILEELFHRSRLNTIRSRYLGLETGEDGRVYPTIRLYGTETMRWAYSDPPLQQWPQEIRHLIVPKPGHVFVSADYSQLEARIMAVLVQEKVDLDAFADPLRDVHIETAIKCLEMEADWSDLGIWAVQGYAKQGASKLDRYNIICPQWAGQDKALKEKQRGKFKQHRYKIMYGASEKGGGTQQLFCPCPRVECSESAPESLNLTPAQEARIAKRWNVVYAKTMRWREKLYEDTVANGRRFTSAFGYTRQFAQPAKEMRNSCWNFPLQHSAAEITSRAVVGLHKLGAPTVLQLHDQLVLEVPEREADQWGATLKGVMEQAIPELGGAVFPVDLHIGATDWSECK